MTKVNLELYQVIKPKLGEKAARMIAEAIPRGDELATRDDIARLERLLMELETRLMHRLLQFFLPMWLTVLAALVAVVWKS